MSPNPNVIESMGHAGLVDVLTRYTLMTPKRADEIAKQYLETAYKFGPVRGKVSFPKRHLKFAEGREGIKNQFSSHIVQSSPYFFCVCLILT